MELSDIKVGELARENFAVIQFFIKQNIDFFCKGTKSLREALEESGAEKKEFLKELEEIRSHEVQCYGVDIDNWPLDLLADYIQKTHHRYTEEALLNIKDLVKEILVNDPEEAGIIREFNTTFELLSGELVKHMKKEELMLFPAIKKLGVKSAAGPAPVFGSVDKLVGNMVGEHDMQYEALRKIREILNGYVPREGKDIYNKLVRQMQGLDKDLALHLHLENNILFPKAVESVKTQVKV